MSFEVLPVNDPANLTVQNVTGQEDGSVSLGAGGQPHRQRWLRADRRAADQGVPDGFHPRPPRRSTTAVGVAGACGTDFSKLT